MRTHTDAVALAVFAALVAGAPLLVQAQQSMDAQRDG